MASVIFTRMPFGARLVTVDPSTPGQWPMNGSPFGKQRLPTEPVGSHTLTLTNIVVGSRVHIAEQVSGAVLYDGIAASSTVVQALSVYAAGSTKNDWRIRIRKASSGTTYRPYETLMTGTVAPSSSSIYVSQQADE